MIQSLRLSTLFLALFVLLIAAYSYKRADSTPPFQLAKVKSIELDWPGTPTNPELQDSPTAETQVFQTPEKDIYMLLKARRRSSSGLDVECAAFIRTLTEPLKAQSHSKRFSVSGFPACSYKIENAELAMYGMMTLAGEHVYNANVLLSSLPTDATKIKKAKAFIDSFQIIQ